MIRPALCLVPDAEAETDTARRLQLFRERNPRIVVQFADGAWEAAIPAGDGDRRIIRHYCLGALLDKLDRLFPPPDITALTLGPGERPRT